MPKEMKILIPTIKIKESVKCRNTAQAYKIFRSLLDYEAVDLKKQEHFWIMAMLFVFILHLLVPIVEILLTQLIFLVPQLLIKLEKFLLLTMCLEYMKI